MGWTVGDILKATGGTPLGICDNQRPIVEISTDSRSLSKGALFVPLKGERFDGHDYVKAAIEAGAAFSLWSRSNGELPDDVPAERLISVDDTLSSYQRLAAYHLRRLRDVTVVAVTGSTGKTTTKDLIAHMLGTRYKVIKSHANYNNEIGVPMTILNLTPDHDVLVVEVAMRGRGQIAALSEILRPHVGVITNIGESHLELLGTREEIARAKGELLENLVHEGVAVLPAASEFLPLLRSCCKAATVITFSSDVKSSAEFRPEYLYCLGLKGWKIGVRGGSGIVELSLPVPGLHGVEDFMAALGVCVALGVSPEELVEDMCSFVMSGLRMEIIEYPGVVVINDAYNAAPDSVKGALQVLSYAQGRKVAVLGDMLELGEAEVEAHKRVGRLAARYGIDVLVAVGKHSILTKEIAELEGVPRAYWVSDCEQASRLLPSVVSRGDTILLKASRAVGLERLVKVIASCSGGKR